MDPAEARALLVEDVQEVLGQVASGLPVARLSAELERASRVFQALAGCNLLERLDSEAFRVNLLRSVHARLYFLRRSRQEGNLRDRRLALSRTEALLDALAAGHDATLDALIDHSIERYVPGWEYEDDFLYFRSIEALHAGADAAALQALARQRRVALGGPPDTRQAVLESLGAGDAATFVEALRRLAAEATEQADARRAAAYEVDLEAAIQWPRGFVSVELLALIALAARRGIRVDETLPLAPLEGRLPRGGDDVEDFFEGIENIRRAEHPPAGG